MKFKGYTVALLLVIIILLIPIVQSLTFEQKFNNIAQTITNVPYYYVDNNLSNVDFSGDKGTHSNFTAQQHSPDSLFDHLTEENTGKDGAIEDYVDNNTSDVDSSADAGSHSDFSAQQTSPDSIYDTLTEENTYSIQETSIQASWSADISASTKYPNDGGDFVGDGGYGKLRTAVKFSLDQLPNNAVLAGVTFTIYCYDGGTATHQVDIHPYNNDGQGDPEVDSASTAYSRSAPSGDPYVDNSPDLRTVGLKEFVLSSAAYTDIENAKAAVNMFSLGIHEEGDNDWYACLVEYTEPNTDWRPTLHISYYLSSSYELDLEVQFTDIISFLPSETLCIYTGTLGAEDLHVDFWNGTGWENLGADLTANSWNNYSVSLTSPTFTVRFNGGTETGDTTEDQWEIDAVLLSSQGTGSMEDAVDNDTSDVDSSADKGTHSNFSAQQSGPDAVYDTLTEENTGGFSNSTLLDDSFEGFPWDTNWNAIPSSWREDNYPVHSGSSSAWASNYYEGYFTCDNLDASDATAIYVDFWFRKTGTDYYDFTLYYYNGYSYGFPIDELDNNGGDNTWIHFTAEITDSQYFVSNFRIRFDATLGYGEEVWVDDIIITKENQGSNNYELDLEVQWTDVPYSLPNEELSIYGGTMGDEDIIVDVWTGTVWETVFTDLSSGWNNVSITDWLTTSTFTIKFRDGTEVGDESSDAWEIDIAQIHVWNEGENYELDLEAQWTNVDYSEANEELCIYGGPIDTEDVRVDVWNGFSWINVFTDLDSGWNNVTVSQYLTSPIFTIRFKGGTETLDTTQNYWNIDATLLHAWT